MTVDRPFTNPCATPWTGIFSRILKDYWDVEHFIAAGEALDEPRHPGSRDVADLLNNLDADRREQVDLRCLLAWRTGPDLAATTPLDERLRLVRMGAPCEADAALVSFQTDPHPHVRAAVLTAERASYLMEHPQEETSWHVLAHAARMMKVPLWNLAPDSPWQPGRIAIQLSLPLDVVPTGHLPPVGIFSEPVTCHEVPKKLHLRVLRSNHGVTPQI